MKKQGFKGFLWTSLVVLGSLAFLGCKGGNSAQEGPSEEETPVESQKEEYKVELPETVYHVGGDSEHQNLSEFLMSLKDDHEPKVIYLAEGTYDIYKEYRDLQMETPPDDIVASDYLDRCVFLPDNTYLIGEGDVTLLWSPERDEITVGEARTWSPLNVRYACYVENITINCHYGRYCIHDDSHNNKMDQGVSHIYKNVRCIYEYSDSQKGFNDTIGFGFSQMNTYLFEDCEFSFENLPAGESRGIFYGHSASGEALEGNEGPTITVRRCKIKGPKSNAKALKLQCLNRCSLRIETLFEDCEIEGGLNYDLYYDEAIQAFDVTFRRSGKPMELMSGGSVRNPYPTKYEK